MHTRSTPRGVHQHETAKTVTYAHPTLAHTHARTHTQERTHAGTHTRTHTHTNGYTKKHNGISLTKANHCGNSHVAMSTGLHSVSMPALEKRKKWRKINVLPGRESNPGLPRDRRRYLPLYYRGLTDSSPDPQKLSSILSLRIERSREHPLP